MTCQPRQTASCLAALFLAWSAACAFEPGATMDPPDATSFDAGTSDAATPDPVCGNGSIEADETCEGDCPTSCERVSRCHERLLDGEAAACTSKCVDQPETTTCVGGDDCCPDGCTSTTDRDCVCTRLKCDGHCGVIDDGCGGTRDCGLTCGPSKVCHQHACTDATVLGAECRADEQCLNGDVACATTYRTGVKSGFCANTCSTSADCLENGFCWPLGLAGKFCLARCTTSVDCAPDLVCVDSSSGGAKVCLPAGTGAKGVGAACGDVSECSGATDAACLSEAQGYRGGMCVRVGCSTGAVCPGSSHCALKSTVPEGVCLPDCTSDANCRGAGYACRDADGDGTRECTPIANGGGAVGDACAGVWSCAGGATGRCLGPDPEDYVSGYCTRTCTKTVLGDDCPSGSKCDAGRCFRTCTGASDCRASYGCLAADGLGLVKTCRPE